MPSRLRSAGWLALLGSGLGVLPAQELRLRAAFAADSHGDPPAIEWLRHQVLTARPEWPSGQNPDAAFTVHWQDGRARFDSALPLPAGLTVAGEFELDGTPIQFAVATDGRETWDLDAERVPATVATIVEALHLPIGGPPRALDVAVLVANLAGPAVEGDTTAALLAAGAAQCGELTLATAARGASLRVRGRSGGGLTLPAALVWIAMQRDAADAPKDAADGWRLRAFGSRDGDRAEAARQLQRGGPDALPALRGMLHADEASRVAAVDGLVRLRAAGELPRIVAAADPTMPLTLAAARGALRALWPLASAPTRTATLAALRRSQAIEAALADDGDLDAEADPRYRRLAMLAVVLAGLLGLWMRERTRLTWSAAGG